MRPNWCFEAPPTCLGSPRRPEIKSHADTSVDPTRGPLSGGTSVADPRAERAGATDVGPEAASFRHRWGAVVRVFFGDRLGRDSSPGSAAAGPASAADRLGLRLRCGCRQRRRFSAWAGRPCTQLGSFPPSFRRPAGCVWPSGATEAVRQVRSMSRSQADGLPGHLAQELSADVDAVEPGAELGFVLEAGVAEREHRRR